MPQQNPLQAAPNPTPAPKPSGHEERARLRSNFGPSACRTAAPGKAAAHPMNVPLLDLKRQNAPIERELVDAFERVLHSGQYILGKEVEEFERQAAAVAGVRHGIGVSSGTDAILLALMALGVGPGDEVICPSFTFFATAGCISRTGARPVFADSCPVCFNVNAASLERLITARTRALMPVHL